MYEKTKGEIITTLQAEKRRIAMWWDEHDAETRCIAIDVAITAVELIDATMLQMIHGKMKGRGLK